MFADPPKETFNSKVFLRSLTHKPGVYKMLDAKGVVLYVGKAGNLRSRVSSYFRATGLNAKTLAMIKQVNDVEVIITDSETEALLLEQTLIKSLRPFYNIMWRDGKSYPYIQLTAHAKFQGMKLYRGARNKSKGELFGPYPDTKAVRSSLSIMQRLFRLRQCEDAVFNNRSRPCLQYQIGRCSAPCVNLITAADYQKDVRYAKMFIKGKNKKILAEFQSEMSIASTALRFEEASIYRDKIRNLIHIREQQNVVAEKGDFDVIAALQEAMAACVLILYIRNGCIVGQNSWFIQNHLDVGSLLSSFVSRFYLKGELGSFNLPKEIILSQPIDDANIIVQAIWQQFSKRVRIVAKLRGRKASWCKSAMINAEQEFRAKLGRQQKIKHRFEELREGLNMDILAKHIECFDISHTSGEATVASCVVFDSNGAVKSKYRRFNINKITPGDDYAAMQQALMRRYSRLVEQQDKLPDILIIDGGLGQVNAACKVLQELKIDTIHIIGIAKGPTRKAGFETLFNGHDGRVLCLDSYPEALYLIQQIRDEAHRFAVAGHVRRRSKARLSSNLDSIKGIGERRKLELLKHFGGMPRIRNAGLKELEKVPGISNKLANNIYKSMHGD